MVLCLSCTCWTLCLKSPINPLHLHTAEPENKKTGLRWESIYTSTYDTWVTSPECLCQGHKQDKFLIFLLLYLQYKVHSCSFLMLFENLYDKFTKVMSIRVQPCEVWQCQFKWKGFIKIIRRYMVTIKFTKVSWRGCSYRCFISIISNMNSPIVKNYI